MLVGRFDKIDVLPHGSNKLQERWGIHAVDSLIARSVQSSVISSASRAFQFSFFDFSVRSFTTVVVSASVILLLRRLRESRLARTTI